MNTVPWWQVLGHSQLESFAGSYRRELSRQLRASRKPCTL